MMPIDIEPKGLWSSLLALLGALAAFLHLRKPGAEADKASAEAEHAKAQADHLAWTHMVETVERLNNDVANLIEGRKLRDEQIDQLKRDLKARDRRITKLDKASRDCVEREKALNIRILALEAALTSDGK